MDNIRPTRNPTLILKELKDEVVLYNRDQKTVHILNPTAQTIWEHCDGQHGLDDLEQIIRAEYSIPEGHDVRRDILNTLKTFADKQIILP